jgi:diguanylate cyclase (GGDEF)-like protein
MTGENREALRYKLATSIALTAAALESLYVSAYGSFELVDPAADEVDARVRDVDVVLLDGRAASDEAALLARLRNTTPRIATLIVLDGLQAEVALRWFDSGAQDVLHSTELESPLLPQRLRFAIERVKLERSLRLGYATDLETGLPHRQQLIEHMSQLLALREREPAPMAVLVLRVEGLATTEARYGRETASVLRRKIGVRLRAGLRASDVVASIGEDRFAVLLGSILSPADADRVGAKLAHSLRIPLRVAGHDVIVSAALGIGHYPADGTQPDVLLRRAIALAAAPQGHGEARAGRDGAGGATLPAAAANDD